MQPKHLDKILFALLLAMWVVVGLVVLQPSVEGASGVTHPRFETMSHGASPDCHDGILWIGYAMGILIIAIFTTLILFGARHRASGTVRGLAWPAFGVAAGYVGLWTWLVLSYRDYAAASDPELVLAFPVPSAILIYVLWPFPALFSVLFVLGFKRWVLPDEDYDRFQQIVAARQKRLAEEAAGEAGGEG